MNKTNLINKVSDRVNIPSNAAKVIVDTIFDTMRESLEKGERIEIRGFGSFVVRDYGGYKGRNPKTGKIVDVPPKKLPYFKTGKELKEMVNSPGEK
jgi:integration host factor subunit beta